LVYYRTTDTGANWGTETLIDTATIRHIACWFDKETPGDTGDTLHMIWMDQAASDVHYRSLNIATNALGTLRTIDGSVTISASGLENRCAITKTRSGNLVVAWSTQTEVECLDSTDSGENWTDAADVFETGTEPDWCLLFPADTGSDNDACALFKDDSAKTLTVKMYDESANSWTESAILSSITSASRRINMDGAVRHSDNFIVGVTNTNPSVTGSDLVSFTVDPNDITTPPVDTSTAVILTDHIECNFCGILVNQQDDTIYVVYIDGTNDFASTDTLYDTSTDDMASWVGESTYSEATADDLRGVSTGRTVGTAGGNWQPVWYNDDNSAIYVNLVNDVAIAAAAGATRGQLLTVVGVS